MAKREFLQLAHNYNQLKHGIGGWYISEKLDGQRCLWDGGVSRGHKKQSVPWANTRKDERYKTPQIATGLWTRYGNVIHAPDWWLDELPMIPLDGELYIPGFRQNLMKIVKDLKPGPGWKDVKYHVFDAVPIVTLLEPGEIDNTNFKKRIVSLALDWYTTFSQNIIWMPAASTGFQSRYSRLTKEINCDVVKLIDQTKLPMQTERAHSEALDHLNQVTEAGGEGLIIRAPHAIYECCRTHLMVKLKKLDDAEGTVIGYITGRKTDLGSKLLGKMGALVLQLDDGNRLELSGFTDTERELTDPQWAKDNPETECPDHISSVHFPRGSRVTFRYRGKTADGIPQEARYWRKRQ